MFNLQWIYFMFATAYFSSGQQKQYLPNVWTVTNLNRSINVAATVPGGIYSDLNMAGVIGDLFYRFNDVEYRWIGNESWTYTTNFDVDTKTLNRQRVKLVFEGLDTFSTIWLNGVEVGSSDNMFLKYMFDVRDHLKDVGNNLTVAFKSAVLEAERLYELQAKTYPVPPLCTPKEYRGECHVNHIRKMQASFGWDWGPAVPSVGIWKPVYLLSYESAALQDVTAHISEDGDLWHVQFTVYLLSEPGALVAGVLTVQLATNVAELAVRSDVGGRADTEGELAHSVSLRVPQAHVDRWWPNGHGAQPLYRAKLLFYPAGAADKSGRQLQLGFRTVQLEQRPLAAGLSFYLRVNGVPLFAKGSNWVPADARPERGADAAAARRLLAAARAAHMNMLRVWGGGVYESDAFYELADRLGLLLWQDLMFACAMYPASEDFLRTANREARQQVRRLQHHASLALWAANNENEAALSGNWYGTAGHFARYKRDYVGLYVHTLRAAVLEADPGRPFLASSPSNGLQSEQDGFVARNPYDGHYGDTHVYNYVLDGWDPNTFPIPRFASEYGYQSLPRLATLASATNVSGDLRFDSDFLNSRQHHLAGYFEMKILMNKQFTLPDVRGANYLGTFIYFSQISQAMSIKTETEHYRRWRSAVREDGLGLTMGALYWQLNDVWQAPSWSSIDFKGHWKMLHYYAKNFFAPVLVTASINRARELEVFVVSDLVSPILNASLHTRTYRWNSLAPIKEEALNILILPGYSNLIYKVWIDEYLMDAGCGSIATARNRCFLYLTLQDQHGAELSPDNFVFPSSLRSVQGLQPPNLAVTVSDIEGRQDAFNVTVSTDTVTPFVWLETEHGGQFSDNGFLQVTGRKHVEFQSDGPLSSGDLQRSLTVTSLASKENL